VDSRENFIKPSMTARYDKSAIGYLSEVTQLIIETLAAF
jgi:hypothetical protein